LDPEVKAAGISQERVRAGIYAYLHEHYEEDDVESMLSELSDARQWNNYGSIEAHIDGEPAMRNGLIHAVDTVVGELRDRKADKATTAKGPTYAPVWKLEDRVRHYLDTRVGARGDGEVTEEYLRSRMEILCEDDIWEDLDAFIEEPHRQNGLIQAVNNVADQIRQRVQVMQKPEPTVRYESVDVPESVETIEVVDPQTEPRESEVRMQYLPKADADDLPEPSAGTEPDTSSTIDISLVLEPESGKFHIELSERDVPYGPWRGRIQDLHQVLNVAILRVWPEAKRFLALEAPDPVADPAQEPELQRDHELQKGDWVKWGSGPEQCGEIVNFTANGKKVFMRDQQNRIHHYPPHMLTVIQRTEAVA
jgi:hypothetical protein